MWLTLEPHTGHEQAGRRPALVISSKIYNQLTGLALTCPITNRIKEYPFEVRIPEGLPVTGAVLADQIRNLDWRGRGADFICTLQGETVLEVLEKLGTLLIPY
jgi:mRNA interferase MazF